MIEHNVEIATADGIMDTFIVHPERGGPHPVVIFYMDAPGIREELRDMARRLGTVGYTVVLPNMYYRAGTGTTLNYGRMREEGSPERERMWQLMNSINNALITEDTRTLLAFIDAQPYAQPEAIGCVGYCMSGQYVLTVAAAFPDRFSAMASFYGVGLATDRPDSPHLRVSAVKAEMYFGFAEVDSYAPPPVVAELEGALQATDTVYEVEHYPGTEHGFGFPQRPAYNKDAAERHWERLFALFHRRVGYKNERSTADGTTSFSASHSAL
jgi:carboxymethylenebutenolidase